MSVLLIIPETYFSAREQLLLFGGACLLGIPAGAVFDVTRLFRRMIPHAAPAAAVEDLLFFVFLAFLLLGYSFAFARGEFRVFYAAGCFLGFLLYECTVGRVVLAVLCRLAKLLELPGKGLAWICRKVFHGFVGNNKKTEKEQKNDKNPLQEQGGMVYNKKKNK